MKKIIAIIICILSLSKPVFSKFEISFYVPIAARFSIPHSEFVANSSFDLIHWPRINYSKAIVGANFFNTGFLTQVGGNFSTGNEKGVTTVSILTDVGYYFYTYDMLYNDTSKYARASHSSSSFHTINLGGVVKLNIPLRDKVPISFGLGAGVKIPFSYKEVVEYATKYDKNEIMRYSYSDIKKNFNRFIIPYIKAGVDAYSYKTENLAILWSAYLFYDFGMDYNVDLINLPGGNVIYPSVIMKKYSFSSVGVEFMIGLHIGRKH